MKAALESNKESSASKPLSAPRSLACLLAALLHDADDHKYFKPSEETLEALNSNANEFTEFEKLKLKYKNAAEIMEGLALPESIVDDALTMISYVSTSENGNSVPESARE